MNATIGYTSPNNQPLYIGSVPWLKDECTIISYIDDLRIYDRALNEYEIEAEGSLALGWVEPSFV